MYSNEGFAQVNCNGQWGTICSGSFTKYVADTVCRQLGYARSETTRGILYVNVLKLILFFINALQRHHNYNTFILACTCIIIIIIMLVHNYAYPHTLTVVEVLTNQPGSLN